MMRVKGREIRAVLFDLDGTLLDSLEDIADSCNAALRELGMPGHPVESYKYLVGDGVGMLIKRAVTPGRDDPATLEHCAKLYRAHYARNWNNKTRLYDGIAGMLDDLAGRAAVKMAVLSNKSHEFTVQCVEAYLSRWNFAAVLGQREGVPRKPNPTAALEIARIVKVEPFQFLYLGDTATDMQTARAARMTPVGVLWGFRQRDELETNGAEFILGHPSELARMLASDSVNH